jgi:hypothetical protein
MELAEMARTATDCALARFPAPPLRSARECFADEFAAHLRGDDCGRTHTGRRMSITGWSPAWFTRPDSP